MTNHNRYRESYLNKFIEDVTDTASHRISPLDDEQKLTGARYNDVCIRGCGTYLSTYNLSTVCAPCDEAEVDMARKADLLVLVDDRGRDLKRRVQGDTE
jgi:hypothetical protein